jgi:hypothetical protein
MSASYSAIGRSLEDLPELATSRIALHAHQAHELKVAEERVIAVAQ